MDILNYLLMDLLKNDKKLSFEALPAKINAGKLHLSTVRGARQDKRSFLTSFFMLNPSKTLLALNKT